MGDYIVPKIAPNDDKPNSNDDNSDDDFLRDIKNRSFEPSIERPDK